MSEWSSLIADAVVKADVPIGQLTTYKLGGPAAYFAEPGSAADLIRVLDAAVSDELPVLVLGRGSNLVVADAGFAGVVVRLGGEFAEIAIGDGVATAGAAVSLPVLARASVRAGQVGLEFFVGVPGSVGGAVTMNAGCFGSDTASVLIECEIVDRRTRKVRTASPADLEMAYRTSRITAADIVTRATFRTSAGDLEAAEARMREITRWRRQHQPGGTFNAGSVFKNPPGDAAGRIIDELGLKGFGVGSVRVSERHANFFVAEQAASAQDVWDLVHAVRAVVSERAGIDLEPEIRFAGRFDRSDHEVHP